MTRLSLVAGVFVALLACASPRAVKGRSLLQEPDVPFDPAAVAALDSRAVIIAGAGSPATARPNCRDFSSVAYVEAFNPATSSPSYPIVYPRPFTSLDFHFSATNAATNEKLDVHPKFTADISTFSFLLSDGSSAPTYDLTSKVLPVGWRCTFKVDPASVPSGLAPKQPEVFDGATCSMVRRVRSARFLRWLGKTSRVTYSPGDASVTLECRGLPTQTCLGDPAQKVPCFEANLSFRRDGVLTSADGGYVIPGAGGADATALVNGFDQPVLKFRDLASRDIASCGINLKFGDVTGTPAEPGAVKIDDSVCSFTAQGFTPLFAPGTVVINPHRAAARVECRFDENVC